MAKENPADRRYTPEHEWVLERGEKLVVVGITDFAQEQLTDIVYVELPEVGKKIERGGQLAVVESVKSVSDVYAPVSGQVREVNVKLQSDPGLINRDAFGEGWIAVMEMANPDELSLLMEAKDYNAMISGEAN
ncbi:MAG TPA: glycine cleavage system protein GcvH [Syntrophales bacterium]|nr:glycine cleavage system protein GcvH [Syntrophales bacterium]HOL59005.1 glycine cleavage system protein GcvH [Syntrophales bacterium]HPO34717.1 glycine cleavage system protein GcvH [Syntrophales bacterium]